MSAARSAANKKPGSGPRSVPDPALELEAVPEPEQAPEPPPTEADAAPPGAATRPNAWAAPMNALGGFIRAQRQLAKLSLRDMATMTSVSNAYLSQVERGLHQPSLKVLHSIADALQLSTEQLLSQAGWATHSAAAASSADGGTEEAIRADPRLTPEQRTALLGVYRSFVDGTA
jgi:transcriptional regulator with XRE-family HTH domain